MVGKKFFIFPIFLLVLVLFLLTGCAPEVGDSCDSATDCPAGAICDTTVEGGYCLLFECEINKDCPEEAVCVRFDRFETYCMLGCSIDNDCREGQTCRTDVEGSDPFCYQPQAPSETSFERIEDSSASLESGLKIPSSTQPLNSCLE